jgi:hypothetical protein
LPFAPSCVAIYDLKVLRALPKKAKQGYQHMDLKMLKQTFFSVLFGLIKIMIYYDDNFFSSTPIGD